LVVDIGRENGVFTPEEVYQFVTRRADWDRIKKNVDKVVYGMGADDCVIM
jgi:recyclin-1